MWDMPPIRLGAFPPLQGPTPAPDTVSTFVRAAAAAGLDHVCTADHVSFFVGAGTDGLLSATALAMADRTIPIYVAVYLLPLRHPTLVARQVGEMRRIMVASPSYLDVRGEPKRPEAVALHDTIRFGATFGLADWRFVENGNEIRVSHTPRLLTNSADAAVQYAEAGGGLTRVLAYQAADAIKRGRLKIVLAQFELPAFPINIVYPTSRLLSAKVRTFIDLVTETCDWNFG